MKENIKIHVSELFKRNNINNAQLENHLIKSLEEKYDYFYEKNNNELISFNKAISLIGDINEMINTNSVILKEEKKEISNKEKKQASKFSKINLVVTVTIFFIISFAFGCWLTSWLIFFISFFIECIYKLFCFKDKFSKTTKYIFTSIFSLLAAFSLLLVSLGIGLSLYDDSFSFEEKYIRKEIVIDSNIDKIKINLISSDVIVENYEGVNIKIVQYSKENLPNKYLFSTKINENIYEVNENNAPLFLFNKYYHSIYKVYIPNNINDLKIDIFGISSDIEIKANLVFNEIKLESTSGSIKLSNLKVLNKLIIKVLKGKLDINNVESNNVNELSSSSGRIDINNSKLNNCNLSSITGIMILNNSSINILKVNTLKSYIQGEELTGCFDIYNENGNVYLKNLNLEDESKIDTKKGNIVLIFDQDQILNIDAFSEKGNVKNKYLDNSLGIKLNVKSFTGNIEINNKE